MKNINIIIINNNNTFAAVNTHKYKNLLQRSM